MWGGSLQGARRGTLGALALCVFVGCRGERPAPAPASPRDDAAAQGSGPSTPDGSREPVTAPMAGTDEAPDPQVVTGTPSEEPDVGTSTPAPSINLHVLLGTDDPVPVGVAVDPDTGERFLLDARSGLYLLGDDGAVLVAATEELIDPSNPPASEYTDLSACGGRRLLLTARNDGFLFNLGDSQLRRFFCYVPPILERMIPEAGQITGAVGCDETRIFAQPQTFDGEGFLINSQVGVWDLETGTDIAWYDLDDLDYIAGGLVPWSKHELLLVREQSYHLFDLDTGVLEERGSLAPFGIRGADGLAIDRAAGELLIVDGRVDRLFTLPLEWLALD